MRNLARGNTGAVTLTKGDAQSCQLALARLSKLAEELNTLKPTPSAPNFAFSLEDAVTEFCSAKRLLPSLSLVDAARALASTVVNIRRVSLELASAEFTAEREAKTKSTEGKRAALSPRMVCQDRIRLGRFVSATGDVDVCELKPEHFDAYFSKHTKDLAPKTRNHIRSTLSVFLKWCVRKAYLSESHGIRRSNWLCPDGNSNEPTEAGEVVVYSASELGALLTHAKGPQQALIAIGGLAGLRTEELLRLEWCDVWRRKGFIEVTAQKAKTRSRRLVPILPVLAAWLEPFRECIEGKIWQEKQDRYHKRLRPLFKRAGVVRRSNALRHSFISYRLALVHNEHQVAAEAGTSTQMIHRHYRELVTPEDAERYFNILPPAVDGVVRLVS